MDMSKVFEDEFMDAQASIISLCLEVTGGKVDKVYAYCSNEKKSTMFNAFFVVNGQVKTLDQLGVSGKPAFQFLGLGMEDVKNLNAICAKYNMPAPTELKLYYDVTTGKFNANYKYEEVCSANTEKCAAEVFMDWIQEIKGL